LLAAAPKGLSGQAEEPAGILTNPYYDR
jgi:hypothetical protein